MPMPGFPLYEVIAGYKGVGVKKYRLMVRFHSAFAFVWVVHSAAQPENDWLVDIAHMDSLIDEHTAAIVINNPSNPCGSVFPPDHLREILAVAEVVFSFAK